MRRRRHLRQQRTLGAADHVEKEQLQVVGDPGHAGVIDPVRVIAGTVVTAMDSREGEQHRIPRDRLLVVAAAESGRSSRRPSRSSCQPTCPGLRRLASRPGDVPVADHGQLDSCVELADDVAVEHHDGLRPAGTADAGRRWNQQFHDPLLGECDEHDTAGGGSRRAPSRWRHSEYHGRPGGIRHWPRCGSSGKTLEVKPEEKLPWPRWSVWGLLMTTVSSAMCTAPPRHTDARSSSSSV